jgi:hypothetical protein
MTVRPAFLLILFVAACSSQVVSSYRAPGTDLAVRGIRVVFEDTPLKVTRPGRINNNTINQQRLLLGNSVVDRMPAVLSESKIPGSSRMLPPAEIPASRDFSAYFPVEQQAWHTLVVTPSSGEAICSGNCDFFFRVSLRLIEPVSRQIVWSATVDQPVMGGVGTRKAIYDYYADDIAKIVLKEVKPPS